MSKTLILQANSSRCCGWYFCGISLAVSFCWAAVKKYMLHQLPHAVGSMQCRGLCLTPVGVVDWGRVDLGVRLGPVGSLQAVCAGSNFWV